jgi:hypothetical protein
MTNTSWTPEKGETYYTYGYLREDLVQPLRWGIEADGDERLLKEGRVFKTKEEAEEARTKRWQRKSPPSAYQDMSARL